MDEPSAGGVQRYNTFAGVFTPTLLTILGVIMFLRLPWVVGNAGLGGAFAIIGLELRLRHVSAHDMVGALVGGVTGLVGATVGAIAGAAYMTSRKIDEAMGVKPGSGDDDGGKEG